MSFHILTPEEIVLYERDGFVVVKDLFSSSEIDKLYAAALADETMRKNALDLNDQSGKKTRLSLWLTLGEERGGERSRSRRIVDSAARLMDSEALGWQVQTKLMQK